MTFGQHFLLPAHTQPGETLGDIPAPYMDPQPQPLPSPAFGAPRIADPCGAGAFISLLLFPDPEPWAGAAVGAQQNPFPGAQPLCVPSPSTEKAARCFLSSSRIFSSSESGSRGLLYSSSSVSEAARSPLEPPARCEEEEGSRALFFLHLVRRFWNQTCSPTGLLAAACHTPHTPHTPHSPSPGTQSCRGNMPAVPSLALPGTWSVQMSSPERRSDAL